MLLFEFEFRLWLESTESVPVPNRDYACMGCGASTAALPATPGSCRPQSDFHSLRVMREVVPTRAWEQDPADCKMKHLSASRDQQLTANINVSTGEDSCRADAADESQRILSSWDSAAWGDGAPRNVPLPPDRRLHEKHMKHFQSFLQEVRRSPRVFVKVVRTKRTGTPKLSQ